MDRRKIPLFPLQTVLFPGMWLPLRVFEERYKQLVRDCRERDMTFGIALIREGQEVGGPADPYPIGTLARIEKITPLDDGHMVLQTQGVQRFRVVHLIAGEQPYLLGEVEMLEEDHPRADLPAALQTQALYEKYLELLRGLGGQISEVSLSGADSNFLSWLVAATLMIGPAERQELLQMDETETRLVREVAMLQEHIRVLEGRQKWKVLPFSSN
ncbi:MAG TPA: LON peptidase substrate-binding domain-containing protein [Candidatus Xenobia bacterium]|jgi:hypothetical protein